MVVLRENKKNSTNSNKKPKKTLADYDGKYRRIVHLSIPHIKANELLGCSGGF